MLRTRSSQESLLHQITNRIRQSLELQEVLDTAAQEIRFFLNIDRVKIYRFDSDGSGVVIAESIKDKCLPSLLGLHFPASDIPQQAREMFIKARQRVIVDVASQRKTLTQLDSPETGKPLSQEDIRYETVHPCHIEYLQAMGVQASLVVPILYQHQLWGLLAVHNASPRHYYERELQVVQLLVNQVSVAIAQSDLMSKVRQQAQQEATINRIGSLLHSPLNLTEIRQTVLEDTVKILQGSGGRLYIFAEPTNQPAQLYTTGEQPTDTFLEEGSAWKELFAWQETVDNSNLTHEEITSAWKQVGRSLMTNLVITEDAPAFSTNGISSSYIITDLTQNTQVQSLAIPFKETPIRSILIIPLQYRHQCLGYLSIFRNGYDTEILWAGHCDSDERNFRPRQSFEVWREIKTEQVPQWSQDEIKLAQSIGIHLYMAVMQKRVESLLRHQAYHDRLTKLPNRLLFDEQLSLALASTYRNGEMLAVAFLDLDHFKIINDTLGHDIGDQLLQQTTQRMKECLRQWDTVARWGGDEFTFLLPHIERVEDVSKIARRLLDVLSAPFFIEDRELYLSASLGIALAPYDGEDASELLKNADTSMYHAKQQGRNNYQFYSPEMNAKAREQLELAADLRKALSKDEFVLYYQPQIDIATGEIVSMEALIRWQHPRLGVVPPNQFIPLAEETGLICPIGEWVIKTACIQHQTWLKAGFPPLRIAVNLSARQFQQQGLVKSIVKILESTQVEPCYLELEITESIAIRDTNLTIKVLQELQQMGIKIAMDDFGTGYSSLNTIKHFPLHTLKIDQSFVRDLIVDPSDAAIAKAIVALGKGLNLKILAEGVETNEQLAFLRSIGCDVAQGYLFSKPLPSEAAIQLLHANKQIACEDLKATPSDRQTVAEPQFSASIQKPLPESEKILLRAKTLEVENFELSQQVAKYKQIKAALQHKSKGEQLVTKFSKQICLGLNIEKFFTNLLADLRQFLATDRVLLYRFEPDWSGKVAYESVALDWMPLLNKTIEDRCFKENYIQYYQKGYIKTIEDINNNVLAPCHVEFLTQIQVKANLVVPILARDLWGLLIAHHCCAPRHWQQSEINLVKQLATLSAIAIQFDKIARQ